MRLSPFEIGNLCRRDGMRSPSSKIQMVACLFIIRDRRPPVYLDSRYLGYARQGHASSGATVSHRGVGMALRGKRTRKVVPSMGDEVAAIEPRCDRAIS